MITVEDTARALLDADVVFGCTDDNAGRLVLSRVASYLLTPVIDCGVLLSSTSSGLLEGIDGRITVLAPGVGCLVCRGRIDLKRAAAEMLTPNEHNRLADEGYAPALQGVEPAVVTYTTQVAAAAVSELLERLIHYGPDPAPSELLFRLHERELSTNDQQPRDRHYCHPLTGKLGLGTTEPSWIRRGDLEAHSLVAVAAVAVPTLRVVGHVDAGDEVPRRLPSKGVILVGPTTQPTWVAF